jgi:hypothetical protein
VPTPSLRIGICTNLRSMDLWERDLHRIKDPPRHPSWGGVSGWVFPFPTTTLPLNLAPVLRVGQVDLPHPALQLGLT